MNGWVKQIIEDACILQLGEQQGCRMAQTICDLVVSKRLAVLPTFLTDEMFNRQLTIFEQLPFVQANQLWCAAVQEYISHPPPKAIEQ